MLAYIFVVITTASSFFLKHSTLMGRHSCCVKQKLRKGLWSPEEDDKLLKYINRFGVGCWSSVPKHAGYYLLPSLVYPNYKKTRHFRCKLHENRVISFQIQENRVRFITSYKNLYGFILCFYFLNWFFPILSKKKKLTNRSSLKARLMDCFFLFYSVKRALFELFQWI